MGGGRGKPRGAWGEAGSPGVRGERQDPRGIEGEAGNPGAQGKRWGAQGRQVQRTLTGGVGYHAHGSRSSSAAPFGNGGLVRHVPSAVREEAAVFLMSWHGSSCLNMVAENYRRRELGCTHPSAYLTQ